MAVRDRWSDLLNLWARQLNSEVRAITRAVLDERTPWVARVIGLAVVAYAACPVDVMPAFVPTQGMVDDLIVLPLGLASMLHLVPKHVLLEHRERSALAAGVSPSAVGPAAVIGLCLVTLLVLSAFSKGWL